MLILRAMSGSEKILTDNEGRNLETGLERNGF